MKRYWGALIALSLALVSVPGLASAEDIDLTFIPEQISANSGFLMVADTDASDQALRITWLVGGIENGYGLLPRAGDAWACYFSSTDSRSTCGPTPFIYSTEDYGIPYELEVSMVNGSEILGNTSAEVTVGGIALNSEVNIDYETGDVNMFVYPVNGFPDSVYYAVYKEDLSSLTGYRALTKDTKTNYWTGSVTLNEETYYIAFKGNSSEDFGGGVVRVSLAEDEAVQSGSCTVENIDISVLIDSGDEYSRSGYKITSLVNQTITGIYAQVPSDLDPYIDIVFANSTIYPYSSVYYTAVFKNLDTGLSAATSIPVYSGGGTKLATISLKAQISVKDAGGADYSCTGKSDGTDCIGGICCDGSCKKKAECCDAEDCDLGESCVSNRCTSSSTSCPSGSSCRVGAVDCGSDIYVTTCSGGVCCKSSSSSNECDGETDGTYCSGGICCSESCIEDAECCASYQCDDGYTCKSYECVASSSGFDIINLFVIILVIVIAGLGAYGAYYYFTKIRKKKDGEEEEEKKEDEDIFSDEDFY